MIYVLTGPVGSGKSLMATQRLIDYASEGRLVAANYHVDFAPICRRRNSALSRASVRVLPSTPTIEDLEALGTGGPTEDQAGLVVLDEAGTFLNARTWGETDRQKIIRWMLLSRKRRWDMVLIVQHVGILDKQIREAVVELCGRIRRTDRIKLLGVKMPKMHMCNLRYGTNANDVVIERWWTRGGDCVKCYDTTALFESQAGAYSVLPATLTKWRYVPPSGWVVARKAVLEVARGIVLGPPARRRPSPPADRPAWVRRLESLPPDDRVRAFRMLCPE